MILIQTLILVTFFYSLLLPKKARRIVILVLVLAVINELITTYLASIGKNFSYISSIYLIANNSLWIFLLFKVFQKKYILIVLLSTLAFALFDFIFVSGTDKFSFNTFIFYSFFYILIFIKESFSCLKNEKLSFFYSNDFILISAPVLFFFGLSFIFGFKSKKLSEVIIFSNFNLYQTIIMFVNIIYYSLINIYIYKERKLKNA